MTGHLPKIAPHVLATRPPAIDRINRLARTERAAGRDLISLGQATSNVPIPVDDATLKELLDRDSLTAYPPDAGLPELRAAICDDLQTRHAVTLDPETQLIITAGANHAGHSALHAILSPGDTVALFTPFYFNHEMAVQLLGGKVKELPCGPGLLPDPDDLAHAAATGLRAVILVSPSNPTGRVIPRETFARILDIAARHGIWVIFDETYEGIVYPGDAEAYSAAYALADHPNLIVVSSFSKCLGLAACRTGVLLAAPEVIAQILKIQDTTVIAAAGFSQKLAAHCLPGLGQHLARIITELAPRRDLLAARLRELPGLSFTLPDGAFFIFADISATGINSWEFVERALREVGLITVPGETCGTGWQHHIRLAFGAVSQSRLHEALDRLRKFWTKLL